eukprot:GHVU01040981.1.p1 GENE.GHVU01040981.1~~GHVU01040981.1.p1  ORF type:complete len:490 (-),score=77.60 GHVU01040981.1:1531-3000(-)
MVDFSPFSTSKLGTSELLALVDSMPVPGGSAATSSNAGIADSPPGDGDSAIGLTTAAAVNNESAVAGGCQPPGSKKRKDPTKAPRGKKSTDVDVSKITWDDVSVTKRDDGSVTVFLCGQDAETMLANTIRDACPKLHVSSAKDPKKTTIIANIAAMHDVRSKYNELRRQAASTVTEVDAEGDDGGEGGLTEAGTPLKGSKSFSQGVRLWNLITSDRHADGLARMSVAPTLEELQSGVATARKKFWDAVALEYGDRDAPEINILQFADEDDILRRVKVDMTLIEQLPGAKLTEMWKQGVTQYRLAMSEYTRSGTHQKEFFGACGGRLLPYYIRKVLQTKPGLERITAANLPPDAKGDSTREAPEVSVASRRSTAGDPKRRTLDSVVDSLAAAVTPDPRLEEEKLLFLRSQREWTEKKARLQDEEVASRRLQADAEARAFTTKQWREAAAAVRSLRTSIDSEHLDANRVELEGQLVKEERIRDDLATQLGM